MQPLAENQITVTKKLFMEGMLRLSRDGYGRSARRAMVLFALVWVAMAVYTLAAGGQLWQTFVPLGMVCLIGLWLCVLLPRSNARRAWRAQQARFGSPMTRTTRLYADHLTVQGDGVEKTVAYGDIRQIRYSRHLMLLVCADNLGVMLTRDGFRSGTAAQAEALIKNSKCEENGI